MKSISENIARELDRFGICIAHKPTSSLQAALSRHTGIRLGTRINEHKLAIRRRDPLPLVFAHAVDCDHCLNWEGTEVVTMAGTKQAREFLEAWHSGTNSINGHVDL
ncbi:unnamed protein product [Schistocephalus solidus]|uniref:FBA_2 domain-containing protein n=1 Tax=Schistocephalus solidus TaxID=70667 RepID=A0A183TE16_SCHSO|nr:unnamed protein product [Schistocephalus solidus]